MGADRVAGFSGGDGEQHPGGGNARNHLRADVGNTSRALNRPPTQSPTVTAGLKWPPETWPKAYAMVSTVRPKARATPSNPIPTSGNLAASTALPQPPSTNQNVPTNSADSRRPSPVAPVGRPPPPRAAGPASGPGNRHRRHRRRRHYRRHRSLHPNTCSKDSRRIGQKPVLSTAGLALEADHAMATSYASDKGWAVDRAVKNKDI